MNRCCLSSAIRFSRICSYHGGPLLQVILLRERTSWHQSFQHAFLEQLSLAARAKAIACLTDAHWQISMQCHLLSSATGSLVNSGVRTVSAPDGPLPLPAWLLFPGVLATRLPFPVRSSPPTLALAGEDRTCSRPGGGWEASLANQLSLCPIPRHSRQICELWRSCSPERLKGAGGLGQRAAYQ